MVMAYIGDRYHSWGDTQAQLRQLLKIDDQRVRCLPYRGIGHALTDILYGLKEFWPTRRNLVVSPWGSPFAKESLRSFLRDAYKVTFIDYPRIKTTAEWTSEAAFDTLLALLVRDHCMTGEVQTLDEELQQLNQLRIPHIEIQFGWAWARANLPLPFGIQLRVIDAEKVIAVVGARAKFMSHSADLMDWSELNWEIDIKKNEEQAIEDQAWVESFEAEITRRVPKIQRYLKTGGSRLYDRSVLLLEEMTGDFFLQQLLTDLGEPPLLNPGFERRCETTNLARWQGPYPWTWWGQKSLSEPEQRGLIMLSAAFGQKQLTIERFEDVYLKCLQRIRKTWGKIS